MIYMVLKKIIKQLQYIIMNCSFFIIALLLLLSLNVNSVEIETLKYFLEGTYDLDRNGEFGLAEWAQHFAFMQPDHQFNSSHLLETFNYFDENLDGVVAFPEILQKIHVAFRVGPKQIHIGFTGQNNEMQVMWITQPQKAILPVVEYGVQEFQLNHKVRPNWTQYNVGHVGFYGRIYRAVMTDLVPSKKYYYRVGDEGSQLFSQTLYFIAPPNKQYYAQKINIAVFGDMGTYAPFGFRVSDLIAQEHRLDPFDFVFHTGDISYAGMNGQKAGETEPIWDLFGQITQKWSSEVSYMPGVGNHERYYNYTAFQKRYYLPRSPGSGENLWFSFDYAQLHIIHISSEHPYNKGSPQYNFIQQDLKKASSNPNTKWIILGAHRPFYCSSQFQFSNRTNLVEQLEDLINQYRVDIVQTGHVHSYQRTYPIYNLTAIKNGCNHTHYVKPKAPVYVVQGTAGALAQNTWESSPEWSAFHSSGYGIGKITITGNQLHYQYINTLGRIIDEWRIIK